MGTEIDTDFDFEVTDVQSAEETQESQSQNQKGGRSQGRKRMSSRTSTKSRTSVVKSLPITILCLFFSAFVAVGIWCYWEKKKRSRQYLKDLLSRSEMNQIIHPRCKVVESASLEK